MTGPARPSAGARGERGVTLVELVAGLALAGLVAAAVVGVLLDQHDFYALSSHRTHARQGVRAAAELVSSELRLAAPGDLLAAGADSVSLRLHVLRGVVCGPAAGSPGRVAVHVFDTVTNPNVPPGFRGWAYADPGGTWQRVDGAPLAVTVGDGRSECLARGAPDRGPGWRYRTVGGWRTAGSFGSIPAAGAVLTRYGRLTYSIEPSAPYSGAPALHRNSQELVAPFADGAGFRYVLSDGTVASRVDPAELGSVRAVRLTGTALGPRPGRRVESELRLHVPLQR
ncbi:MAG: hypothetical protein Q8W44_09410 [Candidatus Palauibacterales bacterium]|nr:hypothetical protein [Candidatus Palauibacterales bacterium]